MKPLAHNHRIFPPSGSTTRATREPHRDIPSQPSEDSAGRGSSFDVAAGARTGVESPSARFESGATTSNDQRAVSGPEAVSGRGPDGRAGHFFDGTAYLGDDRCDCDVCRARFRQGKSLANHDASAQIVGLVLVILGAGIAALAAWKVLELLS